MPLQQNREKVGAGDLAVREIPGEIACQQTMDGWPTQ
jgi:hypothetical protein